MIIIYLIYLLVCNNLARLFDSKYKYFLYLNPIIVYLISKFYIYDFENLGDGQSYIYIFNYYYQNGFSKSNLINEIREAHFGIWPQLLIKKYLNNYFENVDLYFIQAFIHICFVYLIILYALKFKLLEKKIIFSIALFLTLSPSFFELGGFPTRHLSTACILLLFYFSYLKIISNYNFLSIVVTITSILLIFLSKAPLLIPILLFIFLDQIISYQKIGYFKKFIYSFLFFTILVIIYFLFYQKYENISLAGGGRFSWMVSIPFIGIFIKYIYALLSPFPWSNLYPLTNIYGGNLILFIFHIISSLMSLYLFLLILFNAKKIILGNIQVRKLTLFGLIMTLSITKGAIGYHSYLIIYLPFFSPLFYLFRIKYIFIFLIFIFILILDFLLINHIYII